MAVSAEQKEAFKSKSKQYKEQIKNQLEQVKQLEQRIKKEEEEEASHTILEVQIAEIFMNIITNYLAINNVAISTMGIKHENSLDEARKLLYKILILGEKWTSSYIDLKLSEIVEFQKKFADFSDDDRYNFIQRLFFLIDQVEEAYGENSKWKMSFIEIKGRATNLAKNILDYVGLRSKNDPRIEGYQARRNLRDLVEESLIKVAKLYREKYEISGHNSDDMKKALNFLRALGRLYLLENKRTELEKIKKTISLWTKKMNQDMKKKKV